MGINDKQEELYFRYKRLEGLAHAILSNRSSTSFKPDEIPQTVCNLLLMELIAALQNMSSPASDAISQSMAEYMK